MRICLKLITKCVRYLSGQLMNRLLFIEKKKEGEKKNIENMAEKSWRSNKRSFLFNQQSIIKPLTY